MLLFFFLPLLFVRRSSHTTPHLRPPSLNTPHHTSSRLGCQIKVTPLLEGATVTIPEETNNLLGGEDSPPATTTK